MREMKNDDGKPLPVKYNYLDIEYKVCYLI